MYIWIGALLPKKYEKRVRDKCNKYNSNIGLDNVAFLLPQHISLKIVFEYEDYLKAIDVIENALKTVKPFEIKVKGMNKFRNIIWLEIKENETLTMMHESLDKALLNELNINPSLFDNHFIFHSTLYIDNNESKLFEMVDLLRNEEFSDKLMINSYVIGISENGEPGTYRVVKEIAL